MKPSLSLKTLMSIILGLLLILPPVSAGAQPTSAGFGTLIWPDGNSFATFGPNRIVRIGTGIMTHLGFCPPGGIADFLYPFTDIYVVEAGSVQVGDTLTDVNGIPNTALGASGGVFVSEIIAITQPGGNLGPGTYAVIYDECQDGKLDPVDSIFDPAFEVVIPADMPILADPSLAALKATSSGQQLFWEDIVRRYEWVLEIADLADAIDADSEIPGSITIDSDTVKEAIIDEIKDAAKEKASEIFNVFDPKTLPLVFAGNMAKHYQAIAADPPDPNFNQLTVLGPRPVVAPLSGDPLYFSMAQSGNWIKNEEMLAQALLTSMERYQGAQASGNGEWGLVHAREMRTYALLLAGQLTHSSMGLADLHAALSADTHNLDGMSAGWETYREQIGSSGFLLGEAQLAANLGLTPTEINDLKLGIIADQQVGFSKAAMLNALVDVQNNNTRLQGDLANFAAYVDSLISALEANSLVPDNHPIANAGGPYLASEGNPVVFNASGSVSPSSITSFEWDLDGDGEFDDGFGPSPSFIYDRAFNGLVGVRVTNQIGKSAVGYAPVEITNVNSAPAFTGLTPSAPLQEVEVGHSLALGASAIDPDGDGISFEWRVDFVTAGGGAAFNYTPTSADVGVRLIEVEAKDTSPLGGRVSFQWWVAVYDTDPDGDGWNRNVDCDEGDPNVNPGESEILFNDIDDDCSTDTPDEGTPAVVTVSLDLPLFEFQTGPAKLDEGFQFSLNTTFTDSNTANVHTAVIDWGDGAIEPGVVTENSGAGRVDGSHSYGDEGYYTITVCVTDDEGATGCGMRDVEVRNAPPTAFQADLSNWRPECYPAPDNVQCNWELRPGGTRVVQTTNSGAALYYSDFQLSGPITMQVNVRVSASGDDDMFGFAFGFKPGDSTSLGANYYIYDWKKEEQFSNFSNCGIGAAGNRNSQAGMFFSRAFGIPDHMEFWTRQNISISGGCMNPSSGLTSLMPRVFTKWSESRDYVYIIEYTPTNIKIFVNHPNPSVYTKVVDLNGNYPGGRFAFYTFSQANVEFSAFSVVPTVTATEGEVFPVEIPFSDKGILDTHTALINWGDGSPLSRGTIVESGGQGILSASHVYQDNGLYTAQFCITDDDNESFCGNMKVQVSNSSPSVDAGPDQVISNHLSLAPATFTDPGHLDTHTATINWGDGEVVPGSVFSRKGSGTISGEHTYNASGIYTVEICVTDDDGGSGCDSMAVEVFADPGAPDVSATGTSSNEGDGIIQPILFSDVNPTDIHSGTLNWGDGSAAESLLILNDRNGVGVAVQEHVYPDNGLFTMTVEICDQTALCGTTSAVNAVANLPPTVLAEPDVASDGILTNVLLASFSDPGVLDTHTATIDWGDGSLPGEGTVSESGGAGTVTGSHSYGTNGSYTTEVCVTDDDGAESCASLLINVSIPAQPPVIDEVHAESPILEGSSSLITVDATSPSGEPLSYSFDCNDDGTYETGPQAANTAGCSFDDDGTFNVNVLVQSQSGLQDVSSVAVEVLNVAPTAVLSVLTSPVGVGQAATLQFTAPFDPSQADTDAGFRYSLDCDGDGVFEILDAIVAVNECSYSTGGSFDVEGRIKDKDAGHTAYFASIQVIQHGENSPPEACMLAASYEPQVIGSSLFIDGQFADPDANDIHTATVDWGDGSTTPVSVTKSGDAWIVTGSHTYAEAGIYTLALTVEDQDHGTCQAVFEFVIIYDPEGGFVTGGGWIDSPIGAYLPDQSLSGRANFGFVAKYKKGAATPIGVTEFQFRLAGLNFHSSDYQWLVVSGARAQFKGTGTINGSGTFGFLLTAVDGQINGGGGTDKFRIKIWDMATGTIIYDNQLGLSDDGSIQSIIAGGSIVIHKGK